MCIKCGLDCVKINALVRWSSPVRKLMITSLCTYVCAYTVSVYVCVLTCVHVCIHVCMCTCSHVRAYVYCISYNLVLCGTTTFSYTLGQYKIKCGLAMRD